MIMVTEPRLPCYKLGIKFGRSDIIKRFSQSERTGFYFAVLEEGEVGAGDEIEVIERDRHEVKVSDLVHLYVGENDNIVLLERAAQVEALPKGWRTKIQSQLTKLTQ